MKQYAYPKNWDYIKKSVKTRDMFTCQKCKRVFPKFSPNLHVHHIKAISDGGSSELSNLITLCVYCHKAQHKHMYASFSKPKKSYIKTLKFTLKKAKRKY